VLQKRYKNTDIMVSHQEENEHFPYTDVS